MLNKIILIASIAWSFCNAANGGAMVGDFSPMKVGNTWVYSVVKVSYNDNDMTNAQRDTSEKTIKIISMSQNNDSLFYTIVDSTVQLNCPSCVPVINTNVLLELNNINFIYDTNAKIGTPVDTLYNNNSTLLGFPEQSFGFCGYHQLSDSNLINVTFLSQHLKIDTLSFGHSSGNYEGLTSWSYGLKWLQNYGLIYYTYDHYMDPYFGNSSTLTLNLVSFNNQSVPILASRNMGGMLSATQTVFSDTRNQIHWRGLSTTDHLSVQLFDFRGKLIYSSRQLPGSFVLNTSRFSRGAYVLRYQINNETWKNFSFVRN